VEVVVNLIVLAMLVVAVVGMQLPHQHQLHWVHHHKDIPVVLEVVLLGLLEEEVVVEVKLVKRHHLLVLVPAVLVLHQMRLDHL
jgi:hypothetical protein